MPCYINDQQLIFDGSLRAIRIPLKLALNAFIYLPMILTAYALTDALLTTKDSHLVRIGLIALFAYAIYMFVYFLKGLLIAFKAKGNWLWLVILAVVVGFTCVSPVLPFYPQISHLVLILDPAAPQWLTPVAAVVAILFIYTRYHFLTDLAPINILPVYKLGVDLGFRFSN